MAGFQPCDGEVSALSPSKCEVDFSFTKKNKSYQFSWQLMLNKTGPLTHKEHTTFLMIWLFKYVFCMASTQVTLEVQPLTEALAKGHRLVLGPMVLAYLYRGTHANYPCRVEVYFPSATGRQLGFTQAIPLPITESCSMGTSHRAKYKIKAEHNVVSADSKRMWKTFNLHIWDAKFNSTTHFDTWWKHVTRDWFTSTTDIIFAKLFQKWPSTIKDAISCNSVNEIGNVAKEISSASPALPKKILLNKRNHSTMTGDSPGHGQAATSTKPKVVSGSKSLVIHTCRKTSMMYESSGDEDDDEIAKGPTKRPKKDPVIEDLPDLSSPGHFQEFIGFETEDQFDSPVDNTVNS
ncbi:hypothetical protein L3X38_018215 [Prunus dulcis]|uniref:Aminotransferase-like plant mobile domain-containing protein n=1 Tax=Prunus dulcis TaxID=3755 RepID=A0AAD4W8T0_PRUDU|nr:hypothetical protein L3X38_018215 [Prunus dulcis]